MSKYSYNKNFFENIDSEEKAYWLGFLYADGCINRYYRNEKLKAMSLEIGLGKKDENHLYKFLKSIDSNVPVKSKTSKLNNKEYESSRVTVCNTKMCRDLIDLGCTPVKSLTLEYPSIDILPEEYAWHFIRGYIDGDGNIFYNNYKSNNENHKDTISFKLSVIGTMQMLKGIENFFLKNNIPINASYSEEGKAFSLHIHGIDNLKELYNKIYKDSNIYLERKYTYFKNAIEDVESKRQNSSGKRGVYFNKQINKWTATITIDGKKNLLGNFEKLEDAIEARKKSELLK